MTLNGKRSVPDVIVKTDLVLATHIRRSLMLGEARIGEISSTYRLHPLLFPSFTKEEGSGTPANAG
jgi:hypothetical protein